MSVRLEAFRLASNSLQFGVPFASFVVALKPRVALMALRLSETPKSDSLMLPFFVESRLAAARMRADGINGRSVRSRPVEEVTSLQSRTLQIAVHDVLLMQVRQTFEDLDRVACNESFGELAKLLEYRAERAVLDVPAVSEM